MTAIASAETGDAGRVDDKPILELRDLKKDYGSVHALRPATLAFKRGEIHAIVGENGAGKSTLIKLLTGVIRRSGGEIVWEGKQVALANPQESIDHGIDAVHQEMLLCRHLTVAANMFLGEEKTRYGLMRKKDMTREAQRIMEDIGFHLPAGAVLGTLTIGQQQLVATARASLRGTKFLIFDEPTAYLTRQEAAQLFAMIRRLRTAGVTIIYISHRLEEVFEIADRVSVLRDGALVGTRDIKETDENELVTLMINRTIEQIYHKEKFDFGETLLETRNLSGPGFNDVSISVRRGEIVGLYGLIGAGRSEFVLSVFGRHPKTSGEILWKGQPVDIQSERQAINLRHRAVAREPPGPGAEPQYADRLQHQPADLRPDHPRRDDIAAPGSRTGRPSDQRSVDQDAEPAQPRLLDVGRQPAEDRHRQVAQLRRRAVPLRRADGRRRCRNQGRDLSPDGRAVEERCRAS